MRACFPSSFFFSFFVTFFCLFVSLKAQSFKHFPLEPGLGLERERCQKSIIARRYLEFTSFPVMP